MGSTFLTAINVILALYCVIIFFKSLIQFGLPNHPARFTLLLVLLCAGGFFILKSFSLLALYPILEYSRWRAFPLVAGSLGLLLQVISIVGQFSHIQQKIISRIPLMGSVLFFFFFGAYADYFLAASVLAGVLFLTVSVGKVRYQKRVFFKMCFFLVVFWGLSHLTPFADLLLFPVLFYLFIFEQTIGVSAIMEEHHAKEGIPV